MGFHCGLAFLFTFISLITIGLTFTVLVFMLIYLSEMELESVSEGLFIAVIIGLCVSCLALIYGIWASCCGGYCAKFLMAFLYLVFALGVGALGVVLFVMKNGIETTLGNLWEDEGKSEVCAALEKAFSCSGWDNEDGGCHSVIMAFYNKWGVVGGGSLLGLSVVQLISVVMAFHFACKLRAEEDDGPGKLGKDPLFQENAW